MDGRWFTSPWHLLLTIENVQILEGRGIVPGIIEEFQTCGDVYSTGMNSVEQETEHKVMNKRKGSLLKTGGWPR